MLTTAQADRLQDMIEDRFNAEMTFRIASQLADLDELVEQVLEEDDCSTRVRITNTVEAWCTDLIVYRTGVSFHVLPERSVVVAYQSGAAVPPCCANDPNVIAVFRTERDLSGLPGSAYSKHEGASQTTLRIRSNESFVWSSEEVDASLTR